MHIDGPFLARLAQVTGDAALFDAAADQVLSYARVLQDPTVFSATAGKRLAAQTANCGLVATDGRSPECSIRSRALPAGNPARAEIRDRIMRLLSALESHQAADGLWHTVITDHATYTEATLAAMLSVGLREAARCNLIDTRPYDRMRTSRQNTLSFRT